VPPGQYRSPHERDCRHRRDRARRTELGVIGAVITTVSGAAATRRAEWRAERGQARELLSQVVNAVGLLGTELSYRERRDLVWARVHALEQFVRDTRRVSPGGRRADE